MATMLSRGLLLAACAAALAVTTAALAQPAPAPPGPAHGSAGADAHRAMEARAAEFEAVVRSGRGGGMAFAADQNGYPGPLHVLELRERLALTPDQETAMRALLGAMFAESMPKGERLLDAEARLRRLFAEGRADERSVRAAVAAVEEAQGELRLVHLLTHLRARDLLSPTQRRLYHETRWGASDARDQSHPRHQ